VPVQPLFLLVFLGLAVWLVAPAWSSPTTTTLSGGGGDPAIFLWFLRWVPFALEHGHDLLVAHHLNYPDGVSLMWNTSVFLPGLLLAPLTARFGPVLTFNVLLVLAHGLSAWCAYLAIRRFVPGHLAAAAGGLVYGFSPAMRTQSNHLHMTLAFLVPLMLLALHEILVRQRRSPWLAGAVLGVLAGCQLLIGEEMLAITGLVGFAMFLLLVLGNLRRLRGRIVHALVAFVAASVVFAVIAAWPLSVQFTGAQRVHGDIQKSNRWSDAYGFVVPGEHQALTTDASVKRVRELGGNSVYLGAPLLLVLVALGVRRRSDAVVRVGLALLLLTAVLSLGPRLLVGGRETGVRPPMAYLERLPLLDSLIPSRFAQLTALFAGLLLAVFLYGVWGRGGWWRLAAGVVGLAVLAPLWPDHSPGARTVATPPFFTSASVRELPRDGVTLVLPWPYRRIAMHDLAGRGRPVVPHARRLHHHPDAGRPAALRHQPEFRVDDVHRDLRRQAAATHQAMAAGARPRLRPLAGRQRGRRPDAEPGGHGSLPDRPARRAAGGGRRRLPLARSEGGPGRPDERARTSSGRPPGSGDPGSTPRAPGPRPAP